LWEIIWKFLKELKIQGLEHYPSSRQEAESESFRVLGASIRVD
jgi:hypothetical protein